MGISGGNFYYGAAVAARWDGTDWTLLTSSAVSPLDTYGALGFSAVSAVPGGVYMSTSAFSPTKVNLVARVCPVRVRDAGISPAAVLLPRAGSSLFIRFGNANTSPHQLRESFLGLYETSKQAPGASTSWRPVSAGTYQLEDVQTRAKLTVQVPIHIIDNGIGVDMVWAWDVPPTGFAYDVQVADPGLQFSTRYSATTLTQSTFGFRQPAGTYRARARIRNLNTGVTSGWSPEVAFQTG